MPANPFEQYPWLEAWLERHGPVNHYKRGNCRRCAETGETIEPGYLVREAREYLRLKKYQDSPEGAMRRQFNRRGRRLRPKIFARDGYRCQICGRHESELTEGRANRFIMARLTIDHIIPIARGGTNELDNLRTACLECNIYRGAPSVEQLP